MGCFNAICARSAAGDLQICPQRTQTSWPGRIVGPGRLRLRVTRQATRSTGPFFQWDLRFRWRRSVFRLPLRRIGLTRIRRKFVFKGEHFFVYHGAEPRPPSVLLCLSNADGTPWVVENVPVNPGSRPEVLPNLGGIRQGGIFRGGAGTSPASGNLLARHRMARWPPGRAGAPPATLMQY